MRSLVVMPNTFNYNSVMTTCENGNQWESVISLLDDMGFYSVKPNTFSMKTAITACKSGERWLRALTLVEMLRKSGVTSRQTVDPWTTSIIKQQEEEEAQQQQVEDQEERAKRVESKREGSVWGFLDNLMAPHLGGNWASFQDRLVESYNPENWPGHVPVMLTQAVQMVLPSHLRSYDGKYTGTYVDCTFGRGGHSREILSHLSPNAKLIAFDVDPEAIEVGRRLEKEDSRFHIVHRPFADMGDVLRGERVSGLLADLGVCSIQLDRADRGFNTHKYALLDLRMNQKSGISARKWLAEATREEIAWVIREYGEDDVYTADRIAQAIDIHRRKRGPIEDTTTFGNIVAQAKTFNDDRHQHPSRLTFQAIRMFLNQELVQLEKLMTAAFDLLDHEGQCCIISFKKSESDEVVKAYRDHEEPDRGMLESLSPERLCELFPLLRTEKDYAIEKLAKEIRPSAVEIEYNKRSRSSTLHTFRKVKRETPLVSHAEKRIRPAEQRFVEPASPPWITDPTPERLRERRDIPELWTPQFFGGSSVQGYARVANSENGTAEPGDEPLPVKTSGEPVANPEYHFPVVGASTISQGAKGELT